MKPLSRSGGGVTRNTIRAAAVAALMVASAAGALAQTTRPPVDLGQATIEDLMNITITSASRKEQRVAEVAAAVYVITQDEIRRSGMTTVPDLLRLVPGVQVAQVNASHWAVSIRGFNGLYSNKLLVLVDGQSVYNRLFSGVWWDMQDLVLDDIDRIEVIRGPGAAIWGANAVNGVINILTKGADNTKGTLVRVGAGTAEPGQVTVRYGGAFGNTDYRVYAQGNALGESRLATGLGADDNWRRASIGFRGDWTDGPHALMLKGNMTHVNAKGLWVNFDPALSPGRPAAVGESSTMSLGRLLGRWTRTGAGGASLQVRSLFDVARRDEPVGDYKRRRADIDVQYHTALGARHDVVAGAGSGVTHEVFLGRTGYSVTPAASTLGFFNVFAQDEITLVRDRLHATLGARVERDPLASWGVQPTARLTWDVVPRRQHVWAATSRALRTPSLTDRGVRVDYPPIVGVAPLPIRATILANPDARAEELADVETGYRLDLGSAATIAISAFYGRYSHLQTAEPLEPRVMVGAEGAFISVPVEFNNLLAAATKGVEFDAHWTPLRVWRLDASYTAFRLTPHLDPASRDAQAAIFDGDAPHFQAQVHSGLSLGSKADADITLYRVGAILHGAALGQVLVPAYTRADARLEVALTRRLTASFVGQNLFDSAHVEFADIGATVIQTQVRRSARAQLVWRY